MFLSYIEDFIYFLERGEEARERNINVWVASHVPPTGNLARYPGMCLDQELNWQPFDLICRLALNH